MSRKNSDLLYRQKNKEMLNNKRKIYAENNKDKINEYNKKYYIENKELLCGKIECECGSTICIKNKSKHFKTKKHLEFDKMTK